jgi:predicted DNA-binding transcriptional regulator AlpA
MTAKRERQVRLLSKMEVCDLTGRTFPTIWAWMRQGKFPAARELNGRPVWVEEEIEEYLANLPVRQYLKGGKK